MTITKYGHCCLLIEIAPESGMAGKTVRILTDPGSYSTAQNEVKGIDYVLITHEHGDHFHIESVKAVLANNPGVKIITNQAVAALLSKENISCAIVGDGQTADMGGVALRGHGTKHAIVYKELGQVENTGYFIGGKLWYPGDAFIKVDFPVDTLALPAGGPWMKISEAIEYALALHPKKCFPVHDAGYASPSSSSRWIKMIMEKEGIDFVPLDAGQKAEF